MSRRPLFRCQSDSLQPPNSRRNELLSSLIPRAAGVIQEARMTSTDVFQQRAKECRRLASATRNRSDRTFWFALVEQWQAVESRSIRQHCLKQVDHLQKRSPDRGSQAAEASPGPAERRQPRG